ncbi:MAG: FAD/NAD(P)-binding protein [Actinomycetota bacterium]
MARHIVIVGGGAAGTLTAIHTARASREPTQATIIERRPALGEGVAYGTADSAHLLNVPASGMSAHEDDPTHLVRWAGCAPEDFVARSRYAEYLRAELTAAQVASPHFAVRHLRASAERITVTVATKATTTLHRVATSDGQSIDADAVVLALGNAAPTRPPWVSNFSACPVVVDPWAAGALDAIDGRAKVLCVGTGLTFVDIALSLARRGARVTGVSRHGLLPNVHAPIATLPALPTGFASPREVATWVRAQPDWRAAFAALRPVTPRLWRTFSDEQQAQFLRHARRHWDVHRHRMSLTVADELARLCRAGVVAVHRGDARAFAESGDYDVVVLCTGPDDAALRSTPPLAGLINDGVSCAGPHGMGIATDADTGQLIDSHGRLVAGLYAIGTLRRGTLWESTAVPEIRAEAQRLAALVLA